MSKARSYSKKEDSKAALPRELAATWRKEVNASTKWLQKWHTSGYEVERYYLAQPKTSSHDTAKFNIFWANVKVILAAVYSKLPVPEVDRTHLDAQDDIARVAAIILERIFEFELKNLDDSPADTFKLAIQDRFVPGLGVVWPRYSYVEKEEKIDAIMATDGKTQLAPAVTKTIVTDEAVPLDYVRWDDFFYSPCRTWVERRWIARRVYWPKEKCVERFGATISGQLAYKKPKVRGLDDPLSQSPDPVAEIFEIWDKDSRQVFWYSHDSPVILDVQEDPLMLTGFFPAKKPLIATHTSTAFIPRPDFAYVQDQYKQLDLVEHRTMLLTEALRVVGVYDKDASALQSLLTNASMNKMIPVDNWAMFAEKGGIKGVIDWFPLEQVVNAIKELTMRKQSLLQEIYEILGLSDLMRGQSVASETATAQQLKAQYGSARMQDMQLGIAEFITEATRTRAEIICKHWQPETIIQRSQIQNTPDGKFAQQAVMLLKDSTQMALRLTVTADTIAAPDWNQEKQLRVDFLQAVSQFITMSAPLLEQDPNSAQYLIQVLQWAAAGFKGGKQIEGVLDQALAALQKQGPQQGPSAKQQAAEAQQAQKDLQNARQAMQKEQQAFQRQISVEEENVRLKIQNIIDKAISTVKELTTTHECKIQLLLANEELEEATQAGDEATQSAESKAKEVAEAKKINDELLKGMSGVVEEMQSLNKLKRSLNIQMPDGTTATAEVTPGEDGSRAIKVNLDGLDYNATVGSAAPPQDPNVMPGAVQTPRPKPQPM